MFKQVAAVLAAVSLLSASGCSTLADARAAKGSGEARVYSASYDQVWDAVPQALKELGLKEEGYSRGSGYVVARSAPPLKNVITTPTLGDNVAIFVDKADVAGKTRVEVVSRGPLRLEAFGTKWEGRILDKLSEKFPR